MQVSDEPLKPGDVIIYWHALYVCGNPMGERYATVREINPDRYLILRLDTMDPLHCTHKVKRVKIMQPDGTLIDNDEPTWREIAEFKIE